MSYLSGYAMHGDISKTYGHGANRIVVGQLPGLHG